MVPVSLASRQRVGGSTARKRGLASEPSILHRIFFSDGIEGYRDKTLNYFRPNSKSPRKACAGFYSTLLGKGVSAGP
jgi:hypothetical protein